MAVEPNAPNDAPPPRPAIDLRALVTLAVLGALVVWASRAHPWVGVVAGVVALFGMLRALGFVLGARAAGPDPDPARPSAPAGSTISPVNPAIDPPASTRASDVPTDG